MKRISVTTPGSGEITDLEIEPGTVASDITEELNLSGYRLHRPGSDDPSNVFGHDENVYTQVEDGEKLKATAEMPVGGKD